MRGLSKRIRITGVENRLFCVTRGVCWHPFLVEADMKYNELVEMWNEESETPWNDLSEEKKIEFAFDEGKRTGFTEIAELATEMSERTRALFA
jgi:hypothetical protein